MCKISVKKIVCLFITVIFITGFSTMGIAESINSYKKIKVKQDQTVYSIARFYKIKPSDIIKKNNLKEPYHLFSGQSLKIPANKITTENKKTSEKIVKNKTIKKTPKKEKNNFSQIVKVKNGDTVYSLARKYEVSTRKIIEENNLKAPFLLHLGRQIKIPKTKIYRVKKKDTIYSISRKFNIDMHSLVKANNIKKPYRISLNQPIIIPFSSSDNVSSAKVIKILPKESFSKKVGKFLWPIRGRILSYFGFKGKGQKSDGINISARTGQEVLAANDGVVLYSGSALSGFGKLLLIKHNGGWVTAYAHNKNLMVKKGERVNRGQKIANIGKTGHVNSPQLHFQIRHYNKVVDPIKYLVSI
jgi:murein DD-endopeptidase MepM/ murein hydrolase activator NlpD